jgi:hypothetical protein
METQTKQLIQKRPHIPLFGRDVRAFRSSVYPYRAAYCLFIFPAFSLSLMSIATTPDFTLLLPGFLLSYHCEVKL